MDKETAKGILAQSISNLQSRKGYIYISDVDAETINNACLYLIKNFNNQIKKVHDVTQIGSVVAKNYISFNSVALSFVAAAKELFPSDFDQNRATIDSTAIIQNICWAGMWDFLRDYFQKNHGIQIDNVSAAPSIFYSQMHIRYQDDVKVSESIVERNVNINYFNNKAEVIISIEPTLSAKKGLLIENRNNILTYKGADPDYKFVIMLDRFEEVKEFVLEMPNRRLKLVYS